MDYKEKYMKYKNKYLILQSNIKYLNNSIESDLVPKSLTSNKNKYTLLKESVFKNIPENREVLLDTKNKIKYNALQKQTGGTIIDTLNGMTQDNFCETINALIIEMNTFISSDKYLNTTELNLMDDETMDKFIVFLCWCFKDNDKLINININNRDKYYKNVELIIQVSKMIYDDIIQQIESNEKTILLVPGDSPIYYFHIIKILHPDILTNPKVTIVEFPGSKLGTAFREHINGNDYFSYILKDILTDMDNNINYIIFDYMESGDSSTYISDTIKRLYNKINIKYNDMLKFQDINIKNYYLLDTKIPDKFLPKIKKYIEEKCFNAESTDKSKKRFDKLFDNADIFNVNSTNNIGYYNNVITIINDIYQDNKIGEKNELIKILYQFIFGIFKSLDTIDNFIEEYPKELYNRHSNLMGYFTGGRRNSRCQYKLPMNTTESVYSATDFITKQKIDPNLQFNEYFKDSDSIKTNYLNCNLLLYLFYIYIKNTDRMKTRTIDIHNILNGIIRKLFDMKHIVKKFNGAEKTGLIEIDSNFHCKFTNDLIRKTDNLSFFNINYIKVI